MRLETRRLDCFTKKGHLSFKISKISFKSETPTTSPISTSWSPIDRSLKAPQSHKLKDLITTSST